MNGAMTAHETAQGLVPRLATRDGRGALAPILDGRAVQTGANVENRLAAMIPGPRGANLADIIESRGNAQFVCAPGRPRSKGDDGYVR
jgi:hypothetical protein